MLIEATPRRLRPKVWMALLVPILAAVPLLAGLGINPFRPSPAAVALESQEAWAALGLDSDRSFAIDEDGRPYSVEVPTRDGNCLVKLVHVFPAPPSPPSRGSRPTYEISRATILQNGTGRNVISRDIAKEVSRLSFSPPSLSRARNVVAALPPTDRWVGPESTILVGSLQGFRWEVRSYDRQRLPAEVAELIALAGLK